MIPRIIYPLGLREKINWRIQKLYPNLQDKNVSLEFNKKLKLDLLKTDVGHRSIIFNGFNDLELTRSIVGHAKKGGLLIDVGANFGYFSCLWASLNSINKVFAFEASPVNVPHLTNNVNKNGLSEAVTIIPYAAGKEKGKLKFDLRIESNQTGWGGLTLNNITNSVEVEVDTLDNIADKYGISQVDLLKIDAEGADTWVLYGAERLLREKKIRHVFFEHNFGRMKLLNIGKTEAKEFLEKLDYQVEQHSFRDFYAYPKQ